MATYYIAPPASGGNDTTGNGSFALPWATISKAQTSSAVGDTIIAKSGTYTSWFPTTFVSRTLTCDVVGGAIFDNSGASSNLTIGGQGTTTVISNIIFQNAIPVSQYDPIFGVASDTAGSVSFISCQFRNIFVSAANVTWGGLIGHTNPGSGKTATLNLTSCLFNDIQFKTGIGGANAFLVGVNSGTTNINGCTSYSSTSGVTALVYLTSCGGVINIKNCIFTNFTGGTINFKVGFTTPTVNASYSDFYLITGSPSGTGVITSDPLFVDRANANFNLRPTSPAVAAGTLS